MWTGENIETTIDAALTGIAREAKRMHKRMIDSTQMQLDGFSARCSDTANQVAETWTTALASTKKSTSESLVSGLDRSLAAFNARFEQTGWLPGLCDHGRIGMDNPAW